jgi:hypothetical protein
VTATGQVALSGQPSQITVTIAGNKISTVGMVTTGGFIRELSG